MSHVLIVEGRFYDDIADMLLAGAKAALDEAGATYDVITVPGAFEIPGVIGFAHKAGKYDGYVALGCVIRGKTTHYDYVCMESARGLNQLAVEFGAPIGYGILTVENDKQAVKRAAPDRGNKGAAAVKACLEMIAIKRRFGGRRLKAVGNED